MKNIFSNILFLEKKKSRENSTYLAAPYRAAAAPKGAPTHWKSTEAAGGGGEKFSDKLWKIYFQIYYFWRKKSPRKFHLPSCSLSCGSCYQMCSNPLKIYWSCRWWGRKVFRQIMKTYIFRYIIFWENFWRKFHLPSCSLSFGSCSQRCCNRLKIHWSCW